LHKQLQALAQPEARAELTAINRGIEKESLRITSEGKLAQTPHPSGLGSALTHPSITTDYSEALLEFITPVSDSIEQSLEQLEDIHSFTYENIDGELLWSASMPCIVAGDAGIPVAHYGHSNVARMKTVYRYGLGHRYGRLMQAIAGIHYNFSMPEAFWERAWRDAGSPGVIADYTTERYLGLIRNFRRLSWLLIYLFGASPAVCASFLKGRDNHGLQPFDGDARSLHLPYGTALRMGSLGYNSDAQKNLSVCYNSLDAYVETLCSAIMQPHPAYRDIPTGQGGDYQQLNDSLLQIENEFYSPIRPKRVTRSGEAPLCALVRAGIEYIEVRCVDISPFVPVGLDAEQVRFMDAFLLYCLLEESPPCDEEEQSVQAANLEAVVSRGRQPGLSLQQGGNDIPMTQWGRELLDAMRPLAALLDSAYGTADYGTSLENQKHKIEDPELTPSARILREMRERDLPFFKVAMAYSEEWANHFRERRLAPETRSRFEEESRRSLQAQDETEQADQVSFDKYLENFYTQYKNLQG
jgi:glutamate--cysteine ligase